jgi:hypothetical protein
MGNKKSNEKVGYWIILSISIFLFIITVCTINLELKPYFKGTIVDATVIGRSCDSKKTNWLYVSYQGKKHSIAIRRGMCQTIPEGEVLKVRLVHSVDIAYFPHQNPVILWIFKSVFLIFFICYSIYNLYTLQYQ